MDNHSSRSAPTGYHRCSNTTPDIRMARVRLAYKLGLAGAVSVWTAGLVCYHTQALDSAWLSSLRAVRFGRAAYAVSCVS